MKNTAKFGAFLLLSVIGRECLAGLPSDYGAVPLDEALARAKQDGRPIMAYFGEDW